MQVHLCRPSILYVLVVVSQEHRAPGYGTQRNRILYIYIKHVGCAAISVWRPYEINDLCVCRVLGLGMVATTLHALLVVPVSVVSRDVWLSLLQWLRPYTRIPQTVTLVTPCPYTTYHDGCEQLKLLKNTRQLHSYALPMHALGIAQSFPCLLVPAGCTRSSAVILIRINKLLPIIFAISVLSICITDLMNCTHL